MSWIHSQMAVAASEDYGKDVFHVKRLIKIFDSFLAGMLAGEEREGREEKKKENVIPMYYYS